MQVTMTASVPYELLTRLEAYLHPRRLRRSDFVRELVEQRLDELEGKKKADTAHEAEPALESQSQ